MTTVAESFPLTKLCSRFTGLAIVLSLNLAVRLPAVWADEASDSNSIAPKPTEPAPPLRDEVDRLLAADSLAPPVAPADDAEFLRRATLDLHGIIPTAEEARAFLNDTAADKRIQLIDRLLDSPRFARHMATTFDVLWLERRTDKNVGSPLWYDFLYQSFLQNKPYDRLVREVLAAVGGSDMRGATKFYQVRACEPDAMTRDIGRLMFGMDMQCNQCHDHPVIDDYKIGDYYGLRAFVTRTYLFQDAKSKQQVVAEKPDGEASFTSVFTGESSKKVVPRLPRGDVLPDEPTFKKGEELVGKPAKGEQPVPKFSRRALLAERATDGKYDLLDRNAANRLWAHVFGRGLVHPIDFMHPDNPPAHPEVLDLVARDFRAHGCDIKHTLRELMLTKTYARSCELPSPQALNSDVVAQRLSARERELAELQSKLTSAEETLKAAAPTSESAGDKKVAKKSDAEGADKETQPAITDELKVPQVDVDKARAEVRHWKTLVNAKNKSVEEARLASEYLSLAQSDAKQATIKWETLVQFWTDRGDVGLLKPMPPEAFADSLMQAAGVIAQSHAKARAAIQKSPPKEMKNAEPEARPRVEAVVLDKQTYEPLRTNYTKFVELYAESPGQDFAATLNQALFFGNAGLVDSWLKPGENNLTTRLIAYKSLDEAAEDLYLSVLTRRPTDQERSAVAAYLADHKQPATAWQELAWALMSSSEFRFNH